MPVIVDVEPGDVIADVFVMVKVNVLVCELNSQTTVAVEAWPEFTPVIVSVSALTVALTPAMRISAASDKICFLKRDIKPLLLVLTSVN